MLRLYGAVHTSPQALLAWALARDFGHNVLPNIEKTPLGKPYFPQHTDLHVSWSHSGALLLCALSACPVGVDIEIIRSRKVSLPPYALTAEEYAAYQDAGGDWPAFYTLWTRKEAWCKYTGQGLRRLWGVTPPEEAGLFYRSYAGPGWQAALCGEEEPPEKILWKEAVL